MALSQSYWPGGYLAAVCLALSLGCQTPRHPRGTTSSTQSAATITQPAPGAREILPAGYRAPSAEIGSSRRSADAPVARSSHPPAPDGAGKLASAVHLSGFRHQLPRPAGADDFFSTRQELQMPQLVNAVLARNRTLTAMRAAWLSAAQRYPQARALDDPVFTSMLAPASLNSGIAGLPGNSAGYMAGAAQKIPWFGKRSLRGDAALAESRAARWDADNARLEIIEAAGLAYYDYFLVRQDLALNVENMAKLRQFHDIAARKYEASLAPQQDMLQAKVELAELAQRQIELERVQRIAIARINTLMHRPPDAYLPPAPSRLDSPRLVLSAAELRGSAFARRPDLAALGSKIRAEQARLELAYKEFLPDFEVYGRYDNFWSQASLRGQVGVNMNLPLYRDKRYAAVREVQWRLAQRRAEYEQLTDDINRDVQTAYERFDEAQQTLGLYVEQILPAARQNVDSAFAAYETSGGDFLRLVAAQRQLIVLQQRYQESIANYHSRRTELERVVGRPLSAPPAEEIPPGR